MYSYDGFHADFVATRPVDVVIRVIRTDSIEGIMRRIVTARESMSIDDRVRLTLICHSSEPTTGGFGLDLGSGLAAENLSVVSPLSGHFVKIVLRSCGPDNGVFEGIPHRLSGHTVGRLGAMRRFYGEFARLSSTEVIAGEMQQYVSIATGTRVMSTMPWFGTRWVYSALGGAPRGIISRLDGDAADDEEE